MSIELSNHFTYKRLLRFVFPSIIMMVFTSIYSIVDGLFVSNFVGKTPFAALNLIFPLIMIFGALGFMVGTGGTAIVSKTMGEGHMEKASQYFSMLVIATVIGGIIVSALGFIFIRPVALAMGATPALIDYCVLYGRILFLSLTAFMLQNVFQSFFVAAAKPHLGLVVTVMAGLTNIVLDFLFIAVFKWGLAGAAIATALSQCVGGIAPLFFFLRQKEGLLRLTKPVFNGRVLLKTCTNGSSELMTNISMSLVNILYNFQLMKLAGENGVAAYGVIMYVSFVFSAIFIGYAIGGAPIISYHYGAQNHSELKNLVKKSGVIIAVFSILMVTSAILASSPLSKVFVGYDQALFELTSRGFKLFSISFLFVGINIFGSALFTALNNGVISAVISFMRTLIFQIAAVLLLPLVLGIDGIWLSVVTAEILAVIVTGILFIRKRNTYHYI